MDLSLLFVLTIAAAFLVLKIIPVHRRIARTLCMFVFFVLQTIIIVVLVGSPTHPVLRAKHPAREFWLQIVTCVWWILAARQFVALLSLPAALRKTTTENKILSDIVAALIYVCSVLAIFGFVFALPLQGIVATSGG
jgi:hypothetical protein